MGAQEREIGGQGTEGESGRRGRGSRRGGGLEARTTTESTATATRSQAQHRLISLLHTSKFRSGLNLRRSIEEEGDDDEGERGRERDSAAARRRIG